MEFQCELLAQNKSTPSCPDYDFVCNFTMCSLFSAHYRHTQVQFSTRVDMALCLHAKLFRNCRYLYKTSIAVVKVLLGSVADMVFFVSQRVVSIVHLPVGKTLKIEISAVSTVVVMRYCQIVYLGFIHLVSF